MRWSLLVVQIRFEQRNVNGKVSSCLAVNGLVKGGVAE